VPRESYLTPIGNDSLRYWAAWLIQHAFLLPIAWLIYRGVFRLRIHGAEHFDQVEGTSFLLAPNHTSAWDSAITFVFLTSSWRRLFSTRLHWTLLADPLRLIYRPVQYFCIWMGVIPVDRKAGMEQFCLQDAMRILKQEDREVALGIYPEGTRSKTGRVARRGKAGIGWFQKRTGVPVVPIYHKGLQLLPWGKNPIEVWIGKPMFFEDYADEPDSPLTWKRIANDVVTRLQEMEQVALGVQADE
jgi:1-acyl-sn-glycerol-3-phosphate acyltransferase